MADMNDRHPISRSYRHAYLLSALTLLIAVRPFFGPHKIGFGLIEILLLVTAIGAALAFTSRRRQFLVVSGLGFLSFALRMTWALAHQDWALPAYLGASLVFSFSVAGLLLVYIFKHTRRITADTICGAISAYLLIGFGWACAYALMEGMLPGSFDFGDRSVDKTPDQVWSFIGFSFTTLTTLGYGNIAPLNARADALTSCEAMIGQFYLTVLVGRLIGLQISQRTA